MPKITEYPKARSFDAHDVLLKDGSGGTKQIEIEDFINDVSDTTNGTAGKLANAGSVETLGNAFNTILNPDTFQTTINGRTYVDNSDGKRKSSAGAYCTSPVYNGYRYRAAVILDSNIYEYKINYYNSGYDLSSGAGYANLYTNYRTGLTYLSDAAPYFVITFRRIDLATLSNADITAILAALSCYRPTDQTLTKLGMAADASITGDKLENGITSNPITNQLFPIDVTGLEYSGSTPGNKRLINIRHNYITVRPNSTSTTASTYQTYLLSGTNPHYVDITIDNAVAALTADDFIPITNFNNSVPLYFGLSTITNSPSATEAPRLHFATRNSDTGVVEVSEAFAQYNSGAGNTNVFRLSDYYLPSVVTNKNLAVLCETRRPYVSSDFKINVFQSSSSAIADAANPEYTIRGSIMRTANGLCRINYNPTFSVISGGIYGGNNDDGASNRCRTQYFDIVPGVTYYISLTDSTYSFMYAYTYVDATQSTLQRGGISPLDRQHIVIDAKGNEHKCRISIYYTADQLSHEFTEEERAAVRSAISITRSTGNLGKTGTYEFFTVPVERPLPFGDENYTTSTENVECVLRLPDTYQPVGKPTRLIFMAHGAHGYIDASTNHWYSSTWKALCDDLLAAGYAVFDTNVLAEGTTDPNEIGLGISSPLYINVVKRAYDYIQDNYNVYKEIFCHGTSMGGTGASAFVQAYPQLVLAESSFAGRDVLKYIAWLNQDEVVSRERMAKVYGYLSYQELTNDKFSHIAGTGPSLSLKKINNDGTITIAPDRETDYQNWLSFWTDLASHARNDNAGKWIGIRTVPYKAWNSWQDSVASTKLEEILQQAFTAGSACPYYIVNYETGTHDDMCYGRVNNMTEQLIAWYKRWE